MVCEQCWCGGRNRKDRVDNISLGACKGRCLRNSTCMGIEYSGGLESTVPSLKTNGICYECLDPGSTSYFTTTSDSAFPPPSVFKRDIR